MSVSPARQEDHTIYQDLSPEEASTELRELVVRLCLNREYGKLQTLLKSDQLSRQQYVQFQPIGWYLDIRWLLDYIYLNREDWDLSFITRLICQDADSFRVVKDRGLTTSDISPRVWLTVIQLIRKTQYCNSAILARLF